MKALIKNNIIVDTSVSEFPVHESFTWMDCPDSCKAGSWELVDGNFQELPEVEVPYDMERARAYPSVGDQLDMIYKDNKNNTTTHADAVEVVKAKYPKPE